MSTPLPPAPRPGFFGSATTGTLTAREHDVLLLLSSGLSNDEIARRLVVSRATVKCHVASVLAKLGARSRLQAVVAAFHTGMVPVGVPSAHRAGAGSVVGATR